MSKINIQTSINAPVSKVWESWNKPEDIMQWCSASDDWGVPHAENDLREGGNFVTTMAAKDGSFSFDFGGVYTKVIEHSEIHYTMSDGRMVEVKFESIGDTTNVYESFDPESQNPIDMQQAGWQAILNNFKKFVEQK